MDVVDKSGLPECAKLIKVGTAIDKRGQLCFTENAELPFKIERVFWISNIPKGESRGCEGYLRTGDTHPLRRGRRHKSGGKAYPGSV